MAAGRIADREITPESVYLDRRDFMKYGTAAASLAATGVAYRQIFRTGGMELTTEALTDVRAAMPQDAARGFTLDEPRTPLTRAVNYNNFYEFTTDKEAVSRAARAFVAKPWQVAVGGMVQQPRAFDLDDLFKLAPLEERVYRMRCVEGWSMVIPWVGFPLKSLIDAVKPMGSARYVAFETLKDPSRFPGQRGKVLDWPYIEGLRLDEAMHPLTILAVGLYGRMLPAQNGAPLRLVVPWKYGFKGIKSIVKIHLVNEQPATTWNRAGKEEYGFYANVNPAVPHPRWSQATEQRLGDSGRRPTLPFNGYAEQVAHLYQGMDLKVHF